MKFKLLATLALSAFVATGANAAQVIYNQGVFGTPAGFTLYSDFNTDVAQSVVGAGSTNYGFPTGTNSSHVALPGNATPYLSVYANGSASINFADAVRSFSFDYSTVDTYNSIRIFYADSSDFDTILGSSLLSAGQIFGKSSGNFIVNGDGRLISGLTLLTSSNSFEVDNLSVSSNVAAVPEPATWLTMILGFGLVGTQLRSRRAKLASA